MLEVISNNSQKKTMYSQDNNKNVWFAKQTQPR